MTPETHEHFHVIMTSRLNLVVHTIQKRTNNYYCAQRIGSFHFILNVILWQNHHHNCIAIRQSARMVMHITSQSQGHWKQHH